MTALIPAAMTVLIIGLVHSWVRTCVAPAKTFDDPMGVALAFGAYLVAALLTVIVWLAWAGVVLW